jgi:DNA-nicking Smr family endonuclease
MRITSRRERGWLPVARGPCHPSRFALLPEGTGLAARRLAAPVKGPVDVRWVAIPVLSRRHHAVDEVGLQRAPSHSYPEHMGSRGGQKKPPPARKEPSPLVPQPFHAPFRDLKAVVKPKAPAPPAASAKASASTTSSTERSIVTPVAALHKTVPLVETPAHVTEEDALAASLAGARPLAKPDSRVRIRRKVDLSHIEEGRKQDLAALDRAEGFDVSFDDRYVRARAAGVSRETLSRLEKGEFPICAHLDLHGMPLDDARLAVDEFLASQQKRGRRCVLLITGKGKNSIGGRAVLREHVPQWLARGPSSRRVLAFVTARPCDGGTGALVVLMRAGSSSKNRIDVEHGGVGRLEP